MTGSQDLQEPTDNPTGWVNKHIRQYVDSGGRKGHRWSGLDTLLITTVGRKTGQRRRTALIYGKDGDRYLVVPSNGGKPDHPLWYYNLVEHPEVELQVGPEVFAAIARTADPDEKPRLWELMAKVFPTYRDYQRKAERDIPVVILERAEGR